MHTLQCCDQAIGAEEPTFNCTPPLIRGFFQFPFGKDDRIALLVLSGPLTHKEQLEALQEVVDAHEEWSDAQVLETLEKAGGRYGPQAKSEIEKRVPIKQLEPLIGKITILRSEFEIRAKGTQPTAVLTWTVVVRAHKQGKKDIKYWLRLEPFGGNLISLMAPI